MRGLLPRRLAVRTVRQGQRPSVVFTFLGTILGGGGLLEERVLAIRVGIDGVVVGDSEENMHWVTDAEDSCEVRGEVLEGAFAAHFDSMRERAGEEASRWLDLRVGLLRQRRSEQAAVLGRDLEVDVADRLHEIVEEEKRSRGLIEATGQQRLFTEQESRGGFEARRGAVNAYASHRRQEIAEFARVDPTGSPKPLGALFLVPAGGQS